MTLNPQIGIFSEFFAISGCDTHFKSELCPQMVGDGPGQPVYVIFLHRTYIFKNLSFDLLNSASLPYGVLKFKYSFKMH